MGDGAARLHTAQLLRRTALFSKHIKSFFRRFSNAVFRIQDESWQDIRTFFLGFSFASFVATASYVPTTIITALLAKATERVWLMLWKQTYFSCFKSHPYKNPFLTYASLFHYFISGRFPIRTKRSIHQTRTIGRGVLCHRFQRIQQVSFIKQEKLFQLATTLLRGGESIFLKGYHSTILCRKCIPLEKSHVTFAYVFFLSLEGSEGWSKDGGVAAANAHKNQNTIQTQTFTGLLPSNSNC